jgi:hypothetical protein
MDWGHYIPARGSTIHMKSRDPDEFRFPRPVLNWRFGVFR